MYTNLHNYNFNFKGGVIPVELNQDILNKVKQNGLELKNLSDELKNNKDIVLAAVDQNPLSLIYGLHDNPYDITETFDYTPKKLSNEIGTCYFNAFVQLILVIPEIREYIKRLNISVCKENKCNEFLFSIKKILDSKDNSANLQHNLEIVDKLKAISISNTFNLTIYSGIISELFNKIIDNSELKDIVTYYKYYDYTPSNSKSTTKYVIIDNNFKVNNNDYQYDFSKFNYKYTFERLKSFTITYEVNIGQSHIISFVKITDNIWYFCDNNKAIPIYQSLAKKIIDKLFSYYKDRSNCPFSYIKPSVLCFENPNFELQEMTMNEIINYANSTTKLLDIKNKIPKKLNKDTIIQLLKTGLKEDLPPSFLKYI